MTKRSRMPTSLWRGFCVLCLNQWSFKEQVSPTGPCLKRWRKEAGRRPAWDVGFGFCIWISDPWKSNCRPQVRVWSDDEKKQDTVQPVTWVSCFVPQNWKNRTLTSQRYAFCIVHSYLWFIEMDRLPTGLCLMWEQGAEYRPACVALFAFRAHNSIEFCPKTCRHTPKAVAV